MFWPKLTSWAIPEDPEESNQETTDNPLDELKKLRWGGAWETGDGDGSSRKLYFQGFKERYQSNASWKVNKEETGGEDKDEKEETDAEDADVALIYLALVHLGLIKASLVHLGQALVRVALIAPLVRLASIKAPLVHLASIKAPLVHLALSKTPLIRLSSTHKSTARLKALITLAHLTAPLNVLVASHRQGSIKGAPASHLVLSKTHHLDVILYKGLIYSN